jgi:hypothetical protein
MSSSNMNRLYLRRNSQNSCMNLRSALAGLDVGVSEAGRTGAGESKAGTACVGKG